MRKILNLIGVAALLVSLAGCEEAEMIKYGAGGQLNVYGWSEAWAFGTDMYEDDREAYTKYSTNFGLIAEDMPVDTLVLGVKVMGEAVDYDRKVYFKLIPDEGVATSMEIVEAPELSYVVPAGAGKVILKYLIKRTAIGETFTGKWAIDFERSDFDKGAEGKDAFTLDVKNILNFEILEIDEELWNMYESYIGVLFGFSDAKARFLINNGITNIPAWLNDYGPMYDCYYLQSLLDEYRSDPNNPPLYDETKLPAQEWIYFTFEGMY